jgi:flavin reductase (DIM6/NTAB) family NADH-FMN oxidoreductase RutF
MAEDSAHAAFDALVGRLDYPMFIVTVAAEGERSGCLVGFTTQCSVDPPRFIACLSKNNRTFRVLSEAAEMAVHVVPEDGGGLVELFGGETGDEVDKFERCRWHEGPRGLPLLDDCPAWFAGAVVERVDAGDHLAVLVEPFAAEDGGGGQYSARAAMEVDPGHPV